MSIAWNSFTPWSALAGGVMIGIAASILLLFNGKIAGISGILGSALKPSSSDKGWRLAFLIGLITSPFLFALASPLPSVTVDVSSTVLIIAGLLVGFGTRYGQGCTSGHGVCGLSRWSQRSFVATVAFMLAGFVTVYVARHLIH